jgi:glycerophosphoryl diester phosphodiesterase
MLAIGHRGACGYQPENTLASFRHAARLGCPWIELDVYHVEGQLVVIHDDDLARTTNGEGLVMESSFAYLRSLDAGNGEQIPTLQEVLELADTRININVELKGPGTAEPVAALLANACQHQWYSEQFLISSFDHGELARANAMFRRGALFGRPVTDIIGRAKQLNAFSVNVSLRMISQELVNLAHQALLKIYVYTVNDRPDIERLRNWGVDGVFSDYPDRVLDHKQ